MCDGDGLTAGDRGIDGDVAALTAVAERLWARPADEARDPEQIDQLLQTLRRCIDLQEVVFARLAAELERSGAIPSTDEYSTWDWVRVSCHLSGAAASNSLAVGRMEPVMPLASEALHEGSIGFGHLALLAGTLQATAGRADGASIQEEMLLPHAQEHTVSHFRFDCKRARHIADADAMLKEQVDAIRFRRLELTPCGGGGLVIDGMLDDVGGAALRSALEPLARKNGYDDDRPRARRLADAIVELATHVMDSGSLPQHNGVRPHLQVTASIETLQGMAGAPAGTLEFASPIPAVTVQRLACDSSLVRILLDGQSAVMDVGRARRVPSAGTLRAVQARDQGCVWPRCDRPVKWTTAHHVQHWARQGETTPDNLVMVCYRHHLMLHEGGWSMTRADDRVVVIPPVLDFVPRPRAPDERTAA